MQNLKTIVQEIVKEASKLKDKHTSEINAPVNYDCIFCQTKQEFQNFKREEKKSVKSKSSCVLPHTKVWGLFELLDAQATLT